VAERGSLDSLPTSTLGQYRVRGRIGSGGMGDVYDAVHTTLDKRVAIKTLRRRFLEDEVVVARFLREGQLASRMRHPHIVDVTDVGVIDGLPCLVMEHLEGETLGQVIRRDGAMKPSTLVDFLLPIIAAVDFAHDHGVLHRDLKPSNIFLARSWNGEVHPKVLDFGISKLVHESTEAALTTDSSFVGTPHYASPESVRAEKASDRRSDQYSMGVILYEGATGVRPFAEKGGSFVTMAMAICAGDFRTPRMVNPELPEAFERVIQQAMALSANDRFMGMRQLGAALLPFASDRARVIWAPSFRSEGTESIVPNPETQMLRTSSGMTAVLQHPASNPSVRPFSMTGPAAAPAGWPPASVRAYSLANGPPSGGVMPSSTPAPSGQHYVPMGMHDRTPSFGAGMNSSVQGMPAPKRSSTALVTVAVVGLVGLALIGAVVLRVSGRAPETESVAGAAGAAFTVDVQSTPDSAVFELDGAAVGNGRLSKQFPRDGQKHVLRISAPGYESLLVQFDESRPPPSLVALRASAQPVASTTLAGGGNAPSTGNTGPKPPIVAAPPNPGPRPGPPPPKGKPTDRPRTDNIDPWE
jgi:eukaryotic-like serine/threonine-protein kinase